MVTLNLVAYTLVPGNHEGLNLTNCFSVFDIYI